MEKENKEISPKEFTRIANNFYTQQGISVPLERISLDSHFLNYFSNNIQTINNKHRVALCFICVNKPYWEFAKQAIEGASELFLPGHDVDYFLFTDMPEDKEPRLKELNVKFFPLEAIEWPMPTLMRFHTMLSQEEELVKYDYVYYCDIDMKFVNVVGDEILGPDITAAQHPMYALKKNLWPPYEPNTDSQAYIKRPGMVIMDEGKKRFMPLYFAGGLQGGKADKFIQAMKDVRKMIDADLANNYIAIWNDESYWNKWLAENPPSTVLSPSYIYPDSLIKEYYEPLWGCSYPPRLVTLTKKFTTSKEGGEAVAKMIGQTP